MPTCQLTFQSIVSPTFDPKLEFGSIGIGDFNGDVHLDLIAYAWTISSVFLFLGNGNGTFDSSMILVTKQPYTLTSMVAADFNNDGYLDLAITNIQSFTVIVILGYGNGTFGAATTYSTGNGSSPDAIEAGDFNGDSYLDIVIANEGSCSIRGLFGYGNGTFAAQISFWSAYSSCDLSIVVRDFNEDSRLDIAFTYYDKSYGGILFGYGDGTFTATMVLSTGSYSFPRWIVVNDFNHDNHLDIAVLNSGNYNIGIFLGNGNGTFQAQMTFSTNYIISRSLIIGDFNGDGHLDLSYSNLSNADMGILLGYGNGTFGKQITFLNGFKQLWLWFTAYDVNSDGRLDIILMGSIKSNILWNTCKCCTSDLFNSSTYTHQ